MGKILHLVGSGSDDGFSGRGVKLRELSVDDADECAVEAGKECGDDNTTYVRLRRRKALCRMIEAVTQPDVGKAEAEKAREAARKAKADELAGELEAARAAGGDALAKKSAEVALKIREAGEAAAEDARTAALLAAKWIPVSALDLSLKDGKHSFNRLFSPKDADILGHYFDRRFCARVDDAERIMGKALAASTD